MSAVAQNPIIHEVNRAVREKPDCPLKRKALLIWIAVREFFQRVIQSITDCCKNIFRKRTRVQPNPAPEPRPAPEAEPLPRRAAPPPRRIPAPPARRDEDVPPINPPVLPAAAIRPARRNPPPIPRPPVPPLANRDIIVPVADGVGMDWIEAGNEIPQPGEPLPEIPNIISPDETIAQKLAHFRNLPTDDAQYMRTIVDLHRATLRGEEEGFPEEARQFVDAFNQQIADVDHNIFILISMLAIKGCLYKEDFTWDTCPEFLKKEFRVRVHDNERNVDIDNERNTFIVIDMARDLYRTLSDRDKEIIFNLNDPDEINRFPLSANGKRVMQMISGLARQELHQGNRAFTEAFQAINQ